MDEMKYLVFGDDFVTGNDIVIHQPTIREIHEFGAMNYLSLVNLIIMRPYDDMVSLWKQGIDYEEISDYDLFIRNMKNIEPEVSQLFFGNLDFRKLYLKINPQNGEVILTNGDIIIDRGIHAQIVRFIRFIHFIPEDDPMEIKPANLSVKKYLIKRMEKKQKYNAKKPPKQNLSNIISALVNISDFPYNYETVGDLHIGQLYSSFYRILKHDNSHYIKQGIYGGTIRGKDVDSNSLEWFGAITKQTDIQKEKERKET